LLCGHIIAKNKCEAGKAELSIADGNTLGFTSTPLFIHGPGDKQRHITDEKLRKFLWISLPSKSINAPSCWK
jgi:hypothetical protein